MIALATSPLHSSRASHGIIAALTLATLLAAPASAQHLLEGTLHSRNLDDSGLRYTEGRYAVPGQHSVHFTVYAPGDAGDHHAVLFLHGYEKSDIEWAYHQMGVAQRNIIGVAIDYDETGSDEEMLNEVATAVEILAQQRHVRSISLCGASWGGKVAFQTIARRPDLPIVTTLLVYPMKPRVTPDEIAAVRSDILNCVGAADPLAPASFWIQDRIDAYNDVIDYKLHIYSEEDFPNEAHHGYFFVADPEAFNEVAIDSFVRGLGYFNWKVRDRERPIWIDDPETLFLPDLVDFEEL
jgi:dienelactone hydrolase